MGIVFFCQSCGARFEVEPRMAGKRGRCRRCGQYTKIPRPEELSSVGVVPVRAAAAAVRQEPARASSRSAGDSDAPSLGAWLKAGISRVGLAPVSADHLPPARPFLPTALDDDGDSKPYALADPRVESRGPVRIQDHLALRLWRREIGGFQKVFRWLNESAYFVSIPFLMILLFGTAVKSRPLALFGATFVVLLNLGRLAAGVANLALVPLRDGLDVQRYRQPVRRVVEPVVTIALVVLGFTFIPWLSGGRSGGSLADRVRAGARGLEEDIKGEVDVVAGKARAIDVGKLGAEAQEKIKGLAAGAEGASPPSGPGAEQ